MKPIWSTLVVAAAAAPAVSTLSEEDPAPLPAAVVAWAGETHSGGVAEARALAAADPVGDALPLVVARFGAADFWHVHRAKEALVAFGDRALPALFVLLGDEREVELDNTADLIFPGAEEFYGHGWVLPYDIDWMPTRAGWVIEEITGERFGFAEEGEGLPHPGAYTDAQRAERRAAAVRRARAWWAERTSFSRPFANDAFVPDEATAVAIAEAVWRPVFGDGIDESRPFRAVLDGGVWVVTGTLPEGVYGGVPHAHVRRHDARILRLFHTQ